MAEGGAALADQGVGHIPLLDELAIVAALAVAVTVLLARLKLPTVAGLLAAGALLGPHGFRLAGSVKAIESLAEVGVVLLLFSVGLEFSLARLRDIFRQVAFGGALQVGLTTAATTALSVALGESVKRGVFYGFVFALSSTAIVLRALAERRELDAPHGRIIVGTLIFQDLCVVPMVLVVPLLGPSGGGGSVASSIGIALAKAVVVVVVVVAISRLVVPKVLGLVDASRSREVFLLAILGLCIGTAWLTALAGLSLALGAFLGGMVVADTEYGRRAMGDILPLRDTFVSIFFVSLGMLFDVDVVFSQPALIGALFAGFLVAKGALATLAAMSMRFPARVAWLAGVGLAQFGEFGFVLTRLAESSGVIDESATGPLLAAGILSMFVTPMLVRAAPHITAGERLLAPLERLIGVRGMDEADAEETELEGHVVIVGYGLAGRFAARALAQSGARFVVLEMNADNVRRGRAEGVPITYADATSEEALLHANVSRAKMVVLLINHPEAAERVVGTIRRVAPGVHILIRARYLGEASGLRQLGAGDVVAEEVEGAIEIIWRMLRELDLARNDIDDRIREVRRGTQTSGRRQTVPRKRLGEMSALSDMKIESARVQEGSPMVGASPVSLRLRTETGALVVGVKRADKLLEQPDPSEPFVVGDIVYFVGTRESLSRALPLFDAQPVADAQGAQVASQTPQRP